MRGGTEWEREITDNDVDYMIYNIVAKMYVHMQESKWIAFNGIEIARAWLQNLFFTERVKKLLRFTFKIHFKKNRGSIAIKSNTPFAAASNITNQL